MEQNNVVKLSIMGVLAVLLFSAFMVPIISNLDYERTTYDNNIRPGTYHKVSDTVEDFTIDIDVGQSTYTDIDGSTVFNVLSRENYLVVSDAAVFVQTYTGSTYTHSAYGWFFDDDGSELGKVNETRAVGGRLSFDAETRVLSFDNDANNIHLSATVSWIYHVDPNGAYRSFQSSSDWYANPDNLVVAGGGLYRTGENDTTYSYYSFNGDNVVISGPYDSELIIQSETINDNVIKANVVIDVGGEEFVPWNIIIPIKVTSGQYTNEQTIIEIIPLLAVFAIVSVIVFAIFKRRADY